MLIAIPSIYFITLYQNEAQLPHERSRKLRLFTKLQTFFNKVNLFLEALRLFLWAALTFGVARWLQLLWAFQ